MRRILPIILAAPLLGWSQGVITTVAGNGTDASTGDGGQATSASFHPNGVTVDKAGNIYIADLAASVIRKVNTAGIISTVAGFPQEKTQFSGDGGPATSASIYISSNHNGLAVDDAGNLYIADDGHHRIRKVSPSGIITTVAGTGKINFSGDGGPATSATLYRPSGVAVDSAGNIYIADTQNVRIRKVDTLGNISTVAGNGSIGYSGDGGPATNAALFYPMGVAVDACRKHLYRGSKCLRCEEGEQGWNHQHGGGQWRVWIFGRWRPSHQRGAVGCLQRGSRCRRGCLHRRFRKSSGSNGGCLGDDQHGGGKRWGYG